MAFLLIGLALLAMKWAEIGPVAAWSWWLVLAPFGLAVAWWGFADSTGLTTRRAMEKMDRRKAERRKRDMEALGLTATPKARRPGMPAERTGKPPTP
jgi:small Trp-rich protein